MKVTITDDNGVVYDTFTVDERSRMGWLLTDSDGDPVMLDEAMTAAADWVQVETGQIVPR